MPTGAAATQLWKDPAGDGSGKQYGLAEEAMPEQDVADSPSYMIASYAAEKGNFTTRYFTKWQKDIEAEEARRQVMRAGSLNRLNRLCRESRLLEECCRSAPIHRCCSPSDGRVAPAGRRSKPREKAPAEAPATWPSGPPSTRL